ncbi:hypothetical protein [Aestuariicoccus sp. MJ-SS9]|uniref:hypothetical protein n=1 Tax=Aestuariicoccus sp. MJ-SS9 TaxID=3079855 RepID=UPI00290C30DA|nr:hypothetical protein [Aestuariicoccus sp. MJ-SS9]MDU8911658.1 hypothetical protein [Aestuariicoccus sp. MJ-SS9]
MVFGNPFIKLTALAATAAALAGCAETADTMADDGLSGTEAQFNAMTAPCIDQAAAFSGAPAVDIDLVNRIRTGGGPLLVLDAGGQRLSCRLEDDGRVTVFSEYAN